MRRHLALAVVFATALAAGLAATAGNGIVTHVCNLSAAAVSDTCPPLRFSAKVSPTRLPGRWSELAPVTVSIDAWTASPPVALRQLIVDFDKDGGLDFTGLPVCRRSRIEGAGTRAARHACRKSIVGTGTANVEIEPAGQTIPVPLTLFNAGARGKKATLFIHGFVSVPTPRSVIATLRLRRIHQDPYGLQAVVAIPPIADGAGSLLNFRLRIGRIFNHEGEKHSFVVARCLTGFLLADVVSYTLSNGESFSGGVLERPCAPQG